VVAALAALLAIVLAAAAEALHARRIARAARLAFGPTRRPRPWASAVPYLRAAAAGALTWGLTTLLLLPPSIHEVDVIPEGEHRHVVLVLDVSPSMRLEDAGPQLDQSRMRRARVLMESFFARVPVEQYRISVVAVYSGAKRVVEDTKDLEVVRNILGDLPMHYAFQPGKTQLFAGLEEAARLAQPWDPRSTVVLVVSDGDTVPASGMPTMPAAVRDVLVVGVGDPRVGKLIDGRQSRQDTTTLRQLAVRLGGVYHDGNTRHLSSETLSLITRTEGEETLARLTLREYALLAAALGALLLALLPLALQRWGAPQLGVPERTPVTEALTGYALSTEGTPS
jgi:Ca-activated chloride channel homolog